MHYLHYRYVAEQPGHQTTRRLFQLLDDLPSQFKHELLRDAFVSFEALSDVSDSKEQQVLEYSTLKAKLKDASEFGEEPVIYGFVCFVLGNVHRRLTQSLPHLIEQRILDAELGLEISLESLQSLQREIDVLRQAYESFCEIVVGPLLDKELPVDFGSEFAYDDSEPLPPEVVKQTLLKQQADSAHADDTSESGPIITTYLDQLAAHFEVSIRTDLYPLVVRVSNKALCVSVTEYCAPDEQHPTRPHILRLNIRGLPLTADGYRRLGLPLHPNSYLNCRLEFSVLPEELALLSAWTADWIRGQESQNPNAPPIPILLAGEERFFEFEADENEPAPHIEGISEEARAAFSSGDGNWREIHYLWSKAARAAYNTWEARDESE